MVILQTMGGAEVSLTNTEGCKKLRPDEFNTIGSKEIVSAVEDILSGSDPVTYVTKLY